MALTKINGNNIDTTTEALIKILQLSGSGSYLELPKYTNQTAIDAAFGSPAVGTIVFNQEEDQAQIYVADAAQGAAGWAAVGGGGASLGEKSIVRTNAAVIDEDLQIGAISNPDPEFANAMSIGPITINAGRTVSIDAGSVYTIIGGEGHAAGLATRMGG